MLAATCQIPGETLAPCEFYGELSLGGELRSVRGILSALCQATLEQHPVILPRGNLAEAQRVGNARIIAAANLPEVIGHLVGNRPLPEDVGAAPVRRQ